MHSCRDQVRTMYGYCVLVVFIIGVSHAAPVGNQRAAAVQCPSGFSLSVDSCFKVVTIIASWAEGQTYCKALNGRLAIIDTPAKNTFVVNLVKKSFKVGKPVHGQFWLGASDLQTEGTWLWMDTAARITFSDWNTGEPNNLLGAADDEDCLVIWSNAGFKWNDSRCELRHSIVCETAPAENFGVIG